MGLGRQRTVYHSVKPQRQLSFECLTGQPGRTIAPPITKAVEEEQ
jgi:hypothetical protein